MICLFGVSCPFLPPSLSQMFKRSWFMAWLYDRIGKILTLQSPNNDLEFFMNWNFEAWNDADIKVGLGEGLFTHHEIGEHAEQDFSVVRAVRTGVGSSSDYGAVRTGVGSSGKSCRRTVYWQLWGVGV
jgi:hypothetical protein